ncbi:MAG: hypothetical protein IH973_01260 [Myxococcales bacterium]|nr:hypothetical protein [Myxococcales bacterium]
MSLRIILVLGTLVLAGPAGSAAAESDGASTADVTLASPASAEDSEAVVEAEVEVATEVEAKVEVVEADRVPDTTPEVPGSMTESEEAKPEAKPTVWVPTEVGKRWTYVYVRERTRDNGDGEPVVETLRGTRIDEITALAPEFGKNVVRVQSNLEGRQAAGAAPSTEERVGFLRYTGTSYQLVAEQTTDPASGIASLVQYDVPLSLLEAGAQPGQRWKVGVRSQGGLHTDLEGEVLGAQDVQTPLGLFEHCLVIRLTGQISGIVEAYGSRMEVPSGDFTLTEWYAPGVGLVLAKEQRTQTLVFEDGTRVEYSERTQFALRSTDSALAAVPAADDN